MPNLFKKCPSCKFEKCWDKAKICEQCGYDFKLQRKPRTQKIVIDEDEDDTPIVIPPRPGHVPPPVKTEEKKDAPVITHKQCPDCKARCWHLAPICETCLYNFKTGESRRQQEEREAYEDAGVKRPEKKEERIFQGYAPNWSDLPREKWMDDFAGPWEDRIVWGEKGSTIVAQGVGNSGGLRSWAHSMTNKLQPLMGVTPLYKGALVDYCKSHTDNPHLRAAAAQIADWYCIKSGVGSYTWMPTMKVFRVEVLTSTETDDFYKRMNDSSKREIAVHHPVFRSDGSHFMAVAMYKPAEIEAFREDEAKQGRFYLPFQYSADARSLRWLPEDWNERSAKDRTDWVQAQFGHPTETVPDSIATPRKAKVIKAPEIKAPEIKKAKKKVKAG